MWVTELMYLSKNGMTNFISKKINIKFIKYIDLKNYFSL